MTRDLRPVSSCGLARQPEGVARAVGVQGGELGAGGLLVGGRARVDHPLLRSPIRGRILLAAGPSATATMLKLVARRMRRRMASTIASTR